VDSELKLWTRWLKREGEKQLIKKLNNRELSTVISGQIELSEMKHADRELMLPVQFNSRISSAEVTLGT